MRESLDSTLDRRRRAQLAGGTLNAIARELDAAERAGEAVDSPEGARFIVLSDTAARRLSAALRGVASLLRSAP